jgi:hypothetical protein
MPALSGIRAEPYPTTIALAQVRTLELAAARYAYGQSGVCSLPSWVPDWRKQRFGENVPHKSRNVNIMVLLAVGYEVQVLEHDAIRLRLMVSDDPNTTMTKLETIFEQKARDSSGNGCWTFKNNHLKHGDVICYFAMDCNNRTDPDTDYLALRKSRTHKDSWVLINSGKEAGTIINRDDKCLDQLRENFKCFRFTQTAIELTIV